MLTLLAAAAMAASTFADCDAYDQAFAEHRLTEQPYVSTHAVVNSAFAPNTAAIAFLNDIHVVRGHRMGRRSIIRTDDVPGFVHLFADGRLVTGIWTKQDSTGGATRVEVWDIDGRPRRTDAWTVPGVVRSVDADARKVRLVLDFHWSGDDDAHATTLSWRPTDGEPRQFLECAAVHRSERDTGFVPYQVYAIEVDPSGEEPIRGLGAIVGRDDLSFRRANGDGFDLSFEEPGDTEAELHRLRAHGSHAVATVAGVSANHMLWGSSNTFEGWGATIVRDDGHWFASWIGEEIVLTRVSDASGVAEGSGDDLEITQHRFAVPPTSGYGGPYITATADGFVLYDDRSIWFVDLDRDPAPVKLAGWSSWGIGFVKPYGDQLLVRHSMGKGLLISVVDPVADTHHKVIEYPPEIVDLGSGHHYKVAAGGMFMQVYAPNPGSDLGARTEVHGFLPSEHGLYRAWAVPAAGDVLGNSPVYTDGRWVLHTLGGRLRVLDARTGRQRAAFRMD